MREIKNLDDVLDYLYNIGFANISEYELEKKLKEKGFDFSDKAFIGGSNTVSRLELILEKLHEDGYINRWVATVNDFTEIGAEPIVRTENKVSIKYNGILFTKAGGYRSKLASLDAEKDIPKMLNRLTFWLVVGSFLLAMMEIVKLYYEHPEAFCWYRHCCH